MLRPFHGVLILSLLLTTGLATGSLPPTKFAERPKLVVLLVIDQFRADYLTRFQHRFLPATQKNGLGGFRYLIEKGAWYPQAQFDMLQNMTGPGHATIATGAYPYSTGIALNEWYDKKTKSGVYCVEDAAFEWLGGKPDSHLGTSPLNLIGSTLGDELKSVHPTAKVVSISLKDRSAILMGGRRADAAIWMNPYRSRWTSTKFYFPQGALPNWVENVNQSLTKKHNEPADTSSIWKGLVAFPSGVKWGDPAAANTPAGLELTEQLAEKAVEDLKLGQGKETDFLAVSFSSHDYAGHTYGPNNGAMEEMTIADDRVLAQFFTFLQNKIPSGMKNVVVVLTADHGVAPNPEFIKLGKTPAGRIDESRLKQQLNTSLETKFGKVDGGWILRVREMNIFLNDEAIQKKSLDDAQVQEEVKRELLKLEGIAYAFSRADHAASRLPPGIFRRQIENSYFPGRSGDVVAILKPFYVSGDETASHQTGYTYDRTIPILLAGENIRAGVYGESAETVDIAPTLAFLTGVIPPSQSHGRVLTEAIGASANQSIKR